MSFKELNVKEIRRQLIGQFFLLEQSQNGIPPQSLLSCCFGTCPCNLRVPATTRHLEPESETTAPPDVSGHPPDTSQRLRRRMEAEARSPPHIRQEAGHDKRFDTPVGSFAPRLFIHAFFQ